jgi:hypothetical protein
MTKAQLQRKIAQLESRQDHLLTELEELDVMLRAVGFDEGLKTLKEAAQELIYIVQHECN